MHHSHLSRFVSAVIASAALTAGAQAAQIYDKDGTTLDVTGRVQAVFHSGHWNSNGHSDGNLSDQVRFGFEGRTGLTDGISAYGKWEVQYEHDGHSDENADFSTREAYVGVDFDAFGKLQTGRMSSLVYHVTELTDIYEDTGCAGAGFFTDDTNLSGQIQYLWEGFGLEAGLAFQTAVDNYEINLGMGGFGWNDDEAEFTFDVDSGFAAYLGYTSPEVLFGPISVRLGYEYLRGQNERNMANYERAVKNVKTMAAGLSWGEDSGLYLAVDGLYRRVNLRNALGIQDIQDDGQTIKLSGVEAAVAYNFECGLTLASGFQWSRIHYRDAEGETHSHIHRSVPVLISYSPVEQFTVWAEAFFDCSSSDASAELLEIPNQNYYVFGVRYTF